MKTFRNDLRKAAWKFCQTCDYTGLIQAGYPYQAGNDGAWGVRFNLLSRARQGKRGFVKLFTPQGEKILFFLDA